MSAGLAILAALTIAHPCKWHLTITGGQKANAPIVLRVTNPCVNNGGRQITRRLPFGIG